MDEVLIEHIEAILGESIYSKRIGRRLLPLVGVLGGEDIPEEVRQQTAILSRLVVLQDLFDALMEPVNLVARTSGKSMQEGTNIFPDLAPLFVQIEETRRQIAECDVVNYAQLIGWIIARAGERKLLRKGRSGR